MPKTVDELAIASHLLTMQATARALAGVDDVEPGKCEACNAATLEETGVCLKCAALGWRIGDVNR